MERILHVIGKMDRGGAETMIMNLYRILDKKQFQFDFVSFSDRRGDFDDEIESLGGKIFSISTTNPINRMFKLKNLLKNHPEYEIVHCHTLFSNAFHVYAAKQANVPYRIVHSHNTNDISNNSFQGRLYKKLSLKMIDKYGTHFIGCGAAAAKFLFPYKKNVLFLPNSVDTKQYAKIGEKEKDYLNNEFNIDNSYLKIIQVGKLTKVKNQFFSVKIAELLKSKNIKFKMFFIGRGELDNDIKIELEKKELEKDVLLTGIRSDIPELMAGADCMIMPSLYEGFPVVLVEAQAVGIPSLISNSISSEVNLNVGLVEFESLDAPIEQWVDKLVELNKKEKISTENRLEKLANEGFDIYSNCQILTDFYKKIKN